jgi:hypothetical protein
VLFLKPEVTALRDGVNVQAVLELLQERLEFFGVTLHAARALPAAYLETHSILDQHYGVINRISKLGLGALSESALHKLREVFAADLANGARVLGGHQFLAEQKAFSALSLCTLSDNVGTTNLGGGSYALRVNIQGHLNIILNPFHAWQLVPYTTPGNAIDYEFVAHFIAQEHREIPFKKIAFDRWNFRHLKPCLQRAGFMDEELEGDNAIFVEFGQGFQSMSPALRTLETLLLNEQLAHGNHPVLTWNAANAVAKPDPAGNRKLDKSKSHGRIDGMVALAMAVAVAGADVLAPAAPSSPWDDPTFSLVSA